IWPFLTRHEKIENSNFTKIASSLLSPAKNKMKELVNRLSEKKIRPTAMRLGVLDILVAQSSAVSLTDLELGLEHTDRVTLYRTLKTFEEHGLVHRIENGSGIAKYALCQHDCDPGKHDDMHVHFFCNTCQETFCLPNTRIPDINLP